jgi:AcrR family transcriptional regulator
MTRKINPPTTLSPRARAIVTAARSMLEETGPESLTLRHLADRLGMRAPSLYNHFPDKRSLEAALVATGLFELALALEAAARDETEPIGAVARAYRAYAGRHPELFRLMTQSPLPRDLLPADLVDRPLAALVPACRGDRSRAVALLGFVQGVALLELNHGAPLTDVDAAWTFGARL